MFITEFKRKIIANSELKKKEEKSLYKILGLTKEEFLIIYEKLTQKNKAFISKLYDENFIPLDKKRTPTEQSGLYNIKKKILEIKNNPNGYKKKKQKLNLANILNTTKENLKEIIKLLSISDKRKIETYYDSDYNLKLENLTQSDHQKIYNLKKKLVLLIKDPNNIKEINKDNLVIALDIQIEELINLIKLLPEHYQEFIKLHYDNDFNLNPDIKRNSNDYLKIQRCKEKILLLKANPKALEIKKNTLYESLNIKKEELESVISLLSLSDQMLLIKFFDENYNLRNFKKTQYEQNVIANLKNKIKSVIDDPESIKEINKHNIYISLGFTKEKTLELITLLPENYQKYIKEYYDENLNLKLNLSRKASDYTKVKKIKELIIQLDEKQKIEAEKLVVEETKPLYNYLNINLETFKIIFMTRPEDEKQLINTYYNSDLTKNNIPFTESDKYIIFNNIIPRYQYLIIEMSIAPLTTAKFNPAELAIFESLHDMEKTIILMKSKYKTEYIAHKLNVDMRVVRNVTRYFLSKVKEELNRQYDEAIDDIIHDKHLLQLKKEEDK